MNGPVIFLTKGTKVHPRIIGTNFIEGYCVIPNISSYMVDGTWVKVVKVEVNGII